MVNHSAVYNKNLDRFNDCAAHFLKTLTKVFPQFSEFHKARTSINAAIGVKKNMPLVMFILKAHPHQEKIFQRDRDFFMNCNEEELNQSKSTLEQKDKNNDMEYIQKIRDLMKSEYMTESHETTIWKFTQALFMFADKYMLEYIGENYYEYITSLDKITDIMK